MTGPRNAEKIAERIARTVAEAAAATLSQITSQEWKCGSEAEAAPGPICVRFQATEGLQGEFRFDIGEQAAVQLARVFVGDEAPSRETTGLTGDELEALDELLRTIAGAAATALRAHFGKVELKFIGREAAPWTPATSRTLTVSQAGQHIPFVLAFNEEILTRKTAEASSPQPHIGAEQRGAEGVKPSTPDAPAVAGNAAVPLNRHDGVEPSRNIHELMRAGNLDLLLDVELAVTLRFGRREMLLKDILEISSGSVIELDRQVSEPVDLLVDRRAIAKGEVVIVDGNYGLRITEVASREQKIECLR